MVPHLLSSLDFGTESFKAIEKIEAGITYVNAPTIGAEVHLPFGGVKRTGNGFREAGTEAIREFTEIKTVYVDYSGRLQKAQIDSDSIRDRGGIHSESGEAGRL
jgi:delta 1-pyrroline-5-carboxylate dehydrogenase